MKKGIYYYVLSSSVILSRIVGDLHSSLLESGMNKDDENVVERDNDDKNSKHVVQNGTSVKRIVPKLAGYIRKMRVQEKISSTTNVCVKESIESAHLLSKLLHLHFI